MLSGFLQKCIESSGLFPRRAGVLVAVSAGVDSMVLLDLLHRLTPRHAWRLVVAHFNHQLRGRASRQDCRLVASVAHNLGLEFVSGEGDVRGWAARHKISLEMAARELRHQFLAEAALARGLSRIALAHHADDQIELFFIRLLRGAGPDGLSGMRSEAVSPFGRSVHLCRPLLEIPKSTLIGYAREVRVDYREDGSNASLNIFRNRIRKELLPLLRTQYQPALNDIVPRLMTLLRGESDFLRDFVSARPVRSDFSAEPVAIQRRSLQAQLEHLGVPADFETIEFLRLHPGRPICITPPGLKGHVPPDVGDASSHCELVREPAGTLRIKRGTPRQPRFGSGQLRVRSSKGSRTFDGVALQWKMQSWTGGLPPKQSGSEYFDGDLIGKTIVLRHWQTGDRFQLIGMKQAVKLQDLFTNAKIPRQRRHALLVATTLDGEIFWVEGNRIGERFKVTGQTTRSLLWQWERL